MRIGLSAIKPVAPLLAAACIAAILSVLAFFHLSELEADQRRADFARLAHDQTDAIHAEITATLALLHSLRGLFTVSENVTRGEFRAFVRSLEPGSAVQALEWIPRVPHQRRAEIERAARADGLLEFHITERQDQGVMAPAAERAAYYPVFFVEPVSGNEAAIGFDLGSNAVRLAALESAGKSGELVASSRITLVQEKQNQYGFLVFVPVYRGDSAQHQRENLIGFGLGVYRIGALIAAALPAYRAEADFKILVFDDSAPLERRLLYPRGDEQFADTAQQNPLGFTRQIALAGRTWSVLVVPTGASAFTTATWLPALILVAGLVFTVLAFLYLNTIRRRSLFVQNLVDARTAELKNANQALENSQAQLQRLALYDPLTGLANRTLFQDQLNHAIALAERQKRDVVILMIDLDGFKQVNDTLGHQSGDDVLRTVAHRLEDACRSADLVARLGGDEFVILMESGATTRGAVILAENIGASIEVSISLKGNQVTVGASIGIAAFPKHATNGKSLTGLADTAMYRAKKNGELFTVYSPDQPDRRAAL